MDHSRPFAHLTTVPAQFTISKTCTAAPRRRAPGAGGPRLGGGGGNEKDAQKEKHNVKEMDDGKETVGERENYDGNETDAGWEKDDGKEKDYGNDKDPLRRDILRARNNYRENEGNLLLGVEEGKEEEESS